MGKAEGRASAAADLGPLVASLSSHTGGCVRRGCGVQVSCLLTRASAAAPVNGGAFLFTVSMAERSLSLRHSGPCCLCLLFAVGSSGPGSDLKAEPSVGEGRLVLLLGFFHCGKRRLSNNMLPSQFSKPLVLKALLRCTV